jgi:hypothetical protein
LGKVNKYLLKTKLLARVNIYIPRGSESKLIVRFLLLPFNQCVLRNLASAIRTANWFGHEIIGIPSTPGYLVKHRRKRPLSIIRTALFAGFDAFLSLADDRRINCDYLNTRSGEQLRTIVSALKGPLVLCLIIAKDEPLSLCADSEEVTRRRVPLSLKRKDSVVRAVQLESARTFVGAMAGIGVDIVI